jgi:hypothetical protein
MECASHVLYGYPLLSLAPLRDPFNRIQESCDINTLLANLQCVPSSSTVFGNIPCTVYYPSVGMLDAFDDTPLRMLKELSSRVQVQTLLEVESSYHSFYLDLNQDINKEIINGDLELLSKKDWANLSLKQVKGNDKSNIITPEHDNLYALHGIINQKTVYHIYKSLPFNKDLPKIIGRAL